MKPYVNRLKPFPEMGIICAVKKDLDYLLKQSFSIKAVSSGFLMTNIYKFQQVVIAGPYFGSPYAAALVEFLAGSGIKNIIAIGWCGGLDENLAPGDIILPDSFAFEDSTYQSYINNEKELDFDSEFSRDIKSFLRSVNISFKEGRIWTTHSLYRETREKVEYFSNRKAIAVEMENSAILSAASFLNINAVCINIVSDILMKDKWLPGFGAESFKKSRIRLIDGIKDYVSSI